LPILDNLQAFLSSTLKTAGRRPGLLALDVSKKSIGVAGADAGWKLATPLLTIWRTKLKNDIQRIDALLREREAAAAVIGLPFNMDGSEGPRCQAIRQFAADLDKALALPILLWDERLTTFAAEERAEELGLRGQRKAEMLDALAAAEILDDVLKAAAKQA
jgi:putative Holliday junction resolvase